ncbi:MAG TPA: carboxypeptidase-like regulatory domain-containing protein, partial [bacterium]|nr:carboxypeptidase-like regulatory domain-containing protein [bacterium]
MSYREVVSVVLVALLTVFAMPIMAETEPNEDTFAANTVELNVPVSGSLGAGTPVDVMDFFQFTTDSDGLIQIGARPAAELDIHIWMLDTDGKAQMVYRNNTGAGGDEVFQYQNLRAGTYWFIIGRVSGAGDYTGTVNFAPTAEIDPEPNDDVPQASAVSAQGGIVEGHLGYYGSKFTDRYDYWEVTTPDDGRLVLTVNPSGDLNVYLALIDSTNVFSDMSTRDSGGKGGSEVITYNNLARGTYFILVHSAEGFGSYTLISQFTANTGANDTDQNDGTATAIEIPLTVDSGNASLFVGTADGRLGYYGNKLLDQGDFYRVTLPGYGKLTMAATKGDGDNVDLGYNLYNDQQQYMDGSGSDSWSADGLQAGEYYIQVFLESRYGAYTLTCTFEQREAPAPFSQPSTEIAPNGAITDIPLDADRTLQYLYVDLPQDGRLVVNSTYTNGIHATTTLFHADGTSSIGSQGFYYVADTRAIAPDDLRAGHYIIQMQRHGGSGLCTVTTEFTPVRNTDVEPNDVWLAIPCIPIEGDVVDLPISGSLGYGGNGWRDRMDCYLLDVKDDGALWVTANTDSTIHYEISLYEFPGPCNRRISNTGGYYTTDARTVGDNDIAAGQYIVYLWRHGGYASYDIKVNFTPNRSSDCEPDDNDWQAVTIQPGEGMVGHLGHQYYDYTDTWDYYRITIPEDGNLQVYFFADDTMHYEVDLYNEDWTWRVSSNGRYYSSARHTVGDSQLAQGTYFLRFRRHGGYGIYNFYTTFQGIGDFADQESNNFITMALPLDSGQMAFGSVGYRDQYRMDYDDWYRVIVSTAGTYKLTMQDPFAALHNDIYLYASDMVTRIRSDGRYYRSDLYTYEVNLDPGTYFIDVHRNGNAGIYTLYFGDPATPVTGTIAGTVKGANNLPLFDVVVQVSNSTARTDFTGGYTFTGLAPGTYDVTFSSGAKYYNVVQTVDVVAGQTTTVNVTMHDANITAPADPEHYFGFGFDRYIHLTWNPTVSPDVAEGGGYRLYISGQDMIDLGYVHDFHAFGFENGQTYQCRLTTYDKFGNESAGVTVPVTPTG